MTKMLAILIVMLFSTAALAQQRVPVKNVAVIETQIDERSGAESEINRAEVGLITNEIRREAVDNLPRGRFNVMTSETVQSMGAAVLEECAEENCVIALGSKIGADYIVRGIISKFRDNFAITIEMYETEYGMLVATAAPVRTTNLEELLEKTPAVCVAMYKGFLDALDGPAAQQATPEPVPVLAPDTVVAAPEPVPQPVQPPPQAVSAEAEAKSAKTASKNRMSAGAGISYASNFGGGLTWANSPVEQISMPYNTFGAYLFFDVIYAEILVGYNAGSGKWNSPNASDVRTLPVLDRSILNVSVLVKYPMESGTITKYPLLGIDYEHPLSGNLKFAGGLAGETVSKVEDLAALWIKFGGGVDMGLGSNVYVRAALLYGVRTTSALEDKYVKAVKNNLGHHDVEANIGHGMTARLGIGYKF